MISETIKQQHPNIPFVDLEAFTEKYHERFYRRLIFTIRDPKKNLGQNTVKFLQCLLQRSRDLHAGLIDCINSSHVLASYLSARAHLETTAAAAYILHTLRKFADSTRTYDDTSQILYRLSLGGRTFPDRDKNPDAPQPIRIGDQIKIADEVFSSCRINNPFRDMYGFLSEFCHPNFLGQNAGVDISKLWQFDFSEDARFQHSDFNEIVSPVCISCAGFFLFYDEAFHIAEQRTVMPRLEK
ncbi:MAG: hypothetical protein KJ964_08095 [Verrucomicrobia bacterium]|nr:hypothetical protein [Verrucomicrobiota bacterium]